jgi:type VI secretion system protein ImpA
VREWPLNHMTSADELLKPLSPENPCGEDLSYDPALTALWPEGLRGKPETQFSPAEEPNWKEVRATCLELCGRSKDLRAAVALAIAELKTDGLAAFREALALMKGLVDTYWDPVYPRLSPDDANDPTERMNIIASMATPLGTYNDPVQFIERLRSAPLAVSLKMGRITKSDIDASKSGAPTEGKPPPSPAQIDAAFRDTKPAELETISKAIADSIALVKNIDTILKEKVGYDKAPDFRPLTTELAEMQASFAAYVSGVAPVEQAGTEPAAGGAASGPRIAIAGDIQSREDVVRMLDKMCDYYKRAEPSSPVPQLLERAKRLARMDFMEAISDLSPDAIARMKDLFGIKDEPSS